MTANSEYEVGALVDLTNAPGFQATDQSLQDPTVVTLTVGRRGEEPQVFIYASGDHVITRTAAGLYAAQIDTTVLIPGVYVYMWQGTGGVIQAIGENWFLLVPQSV